MLLQVGVKILLENTTEQFLLIRRSDQKYQDISQKWDIPGGRINPGNTLIENLTREVFEETGLHLKGEPRLLAAQDIIPSPERHIVRLTYTGQAHGDLQLSEEHTTHSWFTLPEILHLQDLDQYLKALLHQSPIFATL